MDRWNLNRFIKEFDSLSRRLSKSENISVTSSGNLSSTNVQDALEELQSDIDLLTSGSLPTYTKTFGNITSDIITSGTHGLSTIHGVRILTPSGKQVLLGYELSSNDVIIESNISLLNHTLLIY